MTTFLKSLNRNVFGFQDDAPRAQGFGYSYGFQVLRNKNPDLAIEPWFDYIVGINGRDIDNPSATLFATEVRNCAGTSVEFLIQSAKGLTLRNLPIPVLSPPDLSLTLQWAPTALALTVWHITSILPNSPAASAGLQVDTDYIIGTPDAFLSSEAAVSELTEDYVGREVRLYVYNRMEDVTREVKITPSRGWGGDGLLGCELGYGPVHRLPKVENIEHVAGPGETLFDTSAAARPSGETSRPSFDAQQPSQPQAAPPPPIAPLSPPPMTNPTAQQPTIPRPAKPKSRNSAKFRAAFNDVFAEGEAKSKEQDFAPSRSKSGTPVAPPPKIGGAAAGGPTPRAETPAKEEEKEKEPEEEGDEEDQT